MSLWEVWASFFLSRLHSFWPFLLFVSQLLTICLLEGNWIPDYLHGKWCFHRGFLNHKKIWPTVSERLSWVWVSITDRQQKCCTGAVTSLTAVQRRVSAEHCSRQSGLFGLESPGVGAAHEAVKSERVKWYTACNLSHTLSKQYVCFTRSSG